MATLLVVGDMDQARGDIRGNSATHLTFAERISQVGSGLAPCSPAIVPLNTR